MKNKFKIKRYQVVFVDEYNNWEMLGFFDSLAEVEPTLNEYLKNYENDDEDIEGDKLYFGDDAPLGRLVEYPSTLHSCFDRLLQTTEGEVQIRGFIYE